jgi:hypothetical protein
MRIFVLVATYELRVSRKSHLRDHLNSHVYSLPRAVSGKKSTAAAAAVGSGPSRPGSSAETERLGRSVLPEQGDRQRRKSIDDRRTSLRSPGPDRPVLSRSALLSLRPMRVEQCCGSMTFLCGSGSRSADPCL